MPEIYKLLIKITTNEYIDDLIIQLDWLDLTVKELFDDYINKDYEYECEP